MAWGIPLKTRVILGIMALSFSHLHTRTRSRVRFRRPFACATAQISAGVRIQTDLLSHPAFSDAPRANNGNSKINHYTTVSADNLTQYVL